MFKYILAGFLLGAAHGATVPVEAHEGKITKGWKTMDAMGCMLLKECTDGVEKISSIDDVAKLNPGRDWDGVRNEFHQMMDAFNKIGVDVHLADDKYFPPLHRGVYHTVSNHFYLNRDYMTRPSAFMSVMRHEGWHAAQDCMAGTIKNSMIAIILPTDTVPQLWQDIVERGYPKSAWPWEKEATWAGKTEGMTQKALTSCAAGTMWTDYEPTPLTRQYLEDEGFIK